MTRYLTDSIGSPGDPRQRFSWSTLGKKSQLVLKLLGSNPPNKDALRSNGFSYEELSKIEITTSHLAYEESDLAVKMLEDREQGISQLIFELEKIFSGERKELPITTDVTLGHKTLFELLPPTTRAQSRIAISNFTPPTSRIVLRSLIRSGKAQYLQEDSFVYVTDLHGVTVEEVAELKYVGTASLERFISELECLEIVEKTAISLRELIFNATDVGIVIFESQLSQPSVNILNRTFGGIANESAFDEEGYLKTEVLDRLNILHLQNQPHVGATKANNLLRELKQAHDENTDPGIGVSLHDAVCLKNKDEELRHSILWSALSEPARQILSDLTQNFVIENEATLFNRSSLAEITVTSALQRCFELEYDFIRFISELADIFVIDSGAQSLTSDQAEIYFDDLNINLLTGNSSSLRTLRRCQILTVGELFDTTRDASLPKPQKRAIAKLRRAVVDCLYNYNGLNLTTLVEMILDYPTSWKQEFETTYEYSFDTVAGISETVFRDLLMLDQRVQGKTLDSIGSHFGVTRERVRQILERLSGRLSPKFKYSEFDLEEIIETKNEEIRKSEDAARRVELDQIKERAIDLVRKEPGIAIEEISGRLAISIEDIEKSLTRSVYRFIAPADRNFEIDRWSDEDLISALIEASEFASPLSGPEYKDLVDGGYVDGPGPQTIAKRFGTWNQACQLAGVEYVDSVRSEYASKWTQQQMLESIIEFLQEQESLGSLVAYDSWRRGHGGETHPSGAHLRNEFGGWNSARSRALQHMRETGVSPNL